MKKAVTTIILTCDICGTKQNVKSYEFMSPTFDGANNTFTVDSIELCDECQVTCFSEFKRIVEFKRIKENALNMERSKC